MKFLQIKKVISLVLSASLLLSNVSVFAQEMEVPNVISEIKLEELQKRMEKLSKELNKLETSFNSLLKNFHEAPYYMEYKILDDGDHALEMVTARKNWYKTINNYKSPYYKQFQNFQKEMNKFFDEFTALSRDINYAHIYVEDEFAKKVIERLSYKYTGQALQAYPVKPALVDDIAVKHYRKIFSAGVPSDLVKAEKEMHKMYTYFDIRVNVENIKNLKEVGKTALKLDNRAKMFIAQQIKTPKEIMLYAYNNIYEDSQRYAVKITLETAEKGDGLISTVTKLQRYLRTFGKPSQNKISFFNLLKKLYPMTQSARVEYIKNFTKFSEGEKQLIADISKLKDKRKFINKMLYSTDNTKIAGKAVKALAITGTAIGICAILSMLNITQVNAMSNDFSESVDFVELKAAIENGETTPEEDLFYYSSDEAANAIYNEPFHTIKMLETWEYLMRSNNIAQEILKEKETRAEVESKILDGIENFADLEINLG